MGGAGVAFPQASEEEYNANCYIGFSQMTVAHGTGEKMCFTTNVIMDSNSTFLALICQPMTCCHGWKWVPFQVRTMFVGPL